MALTKPTKFPQWATDANGNDNDVVNPTSGQNNVVEPPAAKKLLGWDFKEKPPRNWFNWLARLTAQWLKWLDEQTAETGKVSASTADLSGSPSFDFEYRRQFGVVHLYIPFINGTSAGTLFRFLGALPAAIRPSGIRYCGITGGTADFGGGDVYINTQVQVNNSGDIIFYGAQRTNNAFATTWPATGSRQILGVVVTYNLSVTP